mgnify:CR=1 FL=1
MTPWRPSPLLWASLALHALALPACWLWPARWPWVLGAVVANHLLLMALSLWPRSTALGPNMRRLPDEAAARGEVAITIDDGPHPEVTPQVLTLLARHQAHATFFCIGTQVERHPQLCQAMVQAGHDVQNHGQRHPLLASLMGPAGWRQEITGGAAAILRATGHPPRYYRAVAGLRNPFLDFVLTQLGLRLVSWTRRGFDTRTPDPDLVLARLLRHLRAGDILLLHDGHAARSPSGQPVIVEVLPRLLDALRAQGLRPVTLTQACKPA